ncbi:MAG TPA: response regulator transcription factor [Arcobacter sp.]|nr:response regulator transcription factor [Arcobacter sp.]HIP55815.1 response regulator transcription factor [Arcobacter sp.]
MIKILLLEDDELFASTIIDVLEDESYIITHCIDGEEFLNIAYENYFDLYLLDINVPKINGLDTLKTLREEKNNTPAIFLTSYKDKTTLQNAFKNGADDFLTKPFDIDELNLRILSLLKRAGKITKTITIDDIVFNPKLNTVLKDGNEEQLSNKVAELLKLFYEHNGSIVSKEMIIQRLWSYDEEYSEGSLRVYITKIQKLFSNKKITNIKNIGYKVEF